MGDHLWLQERKRSESELSVGVAQRWGRWRPSGRAWPAMSESPPASQSRAEKAVFEAECNFTARLDEQEWDS